MSLPRRFAPGPNDFFSDLLRAFARPRADRHLGGDVARQDSVLEVELGKVGELRKVLGIEDVVAGEMRQSAARRRQHLRSLVRDQFVEERENALERLIRTIGIQGYFWEWVPFA